MPATAGVEPQPVAAGVGGVQQPKAVAGSGHFQDGPRGAVDELNVAEHPVRERVVGMVVRVAEGTVLGEGPVAQHQRNVPVPSGSGNRSSSASRTRKKPARPRQTCGALKAMRWSWYQSVAARCGSG